MSANPKTTLPRRAVLGALAGASAVAAVCAPSAKAGATIEREEALNMMVKNNCEAEQQKRLWDRAMAVAMSAIAERDRYDVEVLAPIKATLKTMAPKAHLSFEVMASSGQVAYFHLPSNDLHAYDDHMCLSVRAAAAKCREAWQVRRSAEERMNWDECCDEYDRLIERAEELEFELVKMPAPSVAALRWKFDQLFGPGARKEGEDCACSGEWIDAVMQDVQRLLAN